MTKLRLATPEVLIDIHELDGELRYIKEENGTLDIGALARHKDVLESEAVRERYALLADPLVRNMGTIGGAHAHRDPADHRRKGVA